MSRDRIVLIIIITAQVGEHAKAGGKLLSKLARHGRNCFAFEIVTPGILVLSNPGCRVFASLGNSNSLRTGTNSNGGLFDLRAGY